MESKSVNKIANTVGFEPPNLSDGFPKISDILIVLQITEKNEIPFEKIKVVGLRKLSSRKNMLNALSLLKGKAKIRRMMWSRKAQEYLSKINSGNPILISEVIRDLFKKDNQPEPSYSERQMFQSAVERLARELAAVEKIDHFSATEKIESILKSK